MQYRFEDFVLDVDRRELLRGAETVVAGPQVFDLLTYLLRSREHVVTKDDLIDVVWGGRVISESTLTSHINAVRKAIGDTGDQQRLVRTVPRKGYRFVGEVQEVDARPNLTIPHESAVPVLVFPDRPSIAVLPFLNLSGDAGQDYFVDGIVDDIISALSRMRWLFVIARNSSFTYKGRAVDLTQVGQELGVRYVLEGSVRKAGNRVRITGQLIDATTGTSLWAERFESALEDIFALQDQMATSIVGALVPHLESAEIERARHKPTENLDAYDYYLRGMWKFRQVSRQATDEALPMFYAAIERGQDFAPAYAMAAWCHSWRKLSRRSSDLERDIQEGTRLAQRAAQLGWDDAVALAASGHALAHLVPDIEGGIALLDRSLLLDPNLAAGWYLGGFLRIWLGEPDNAIERIAHGMRLSPLGPDMQRMEVGTAMAHLLAGRAGDALIWARKASQHLSDQALPLTISAAIYARTGHDEEARHVIVQLRELDPTLRLSNLNEWLPFQRPQDLDNFSEALRQAGLQS